MKSDKCDSKAIFDIGFIDPKRVNADLLRDYAKETEDNLLKFMERQHYKKKILFPYNFK